MGEAQKGKLIVFSGPSGAGKDSVLERLLKTRENIYLSVSATTRAPRPGEENGRHYHFLTKEEFAEKISAGNMLEYAEYCGNFYGTPRDIVEEKLSAGIDVILEIEVKGAFSVKEKRPDAVMVFVMPPSLEELERRLLCRGTEDKGVLAGRLLTAKEEMRLAKEYDYIIVNDIVEDAAGRLSAIITAEKCRVKK